MNVLQLKKITKKFLAKALNLNGGEFARRILHRNQIFWGEQDGKSIKAIYMHASDPITKWQSINYWQRLLSNKHNGLEFAKMHGCPIPKIYWEGKSINQLQNLDLPEQYVVKPTIGAGSKMVFLMNGNTNLLNKQVLTKAEIIQSLEAALQNDSRLEFIVQEFLRPEKGDVRILDDYKIYTFNGHIAYIQIINRLSPSEGFATFYEENWNQIEQMSSYYAIGKYQDPPICLPEMLSFAKKLSKAYQIFVRIDFYATNKGVVFGEFTPTPSMGKHFTKAGEQLLVSYWDKYCNGMV